MADERNALQARMTRAERDVSELFEKVNKNSANLAAFPFVMEKIDKIERDCAATRDWVETRMAADRKREEEKQRLSLGWWALIVGGVLTLLGSVVTAIATLIG